MLVRHVPGFAITSRSLVSAAQAQHSLQFYLCNTKTWNVLTLDSFEPKHLLTSVPECVEDDKVFSDIRIDDQIWAYDKECTATYIPLHRLDEGLTLVSGDPSTLLFIRSVDAFATTIYSYLNCR